jgi:hypothetical protein
MYHFAGLSKKNGELFSIIFRIPDIIAQFAVIRHKMTFKMIAHSGLWLADRFKTGIRVSKTKRTPVFGIGFTYEMCFSLMEKSYVGHRLY